MPATSASALRPNSARDSCADTPTVAFSQSGEGGMGANARFASVVGSDEASTAFLAVKAADGVGTA
ncbi:hypothetical protein ACFQZM_23470 [Actinomadura fibrosa]|uniref:DUF397 domain-containing protein n=1 Tax=Actinomadura fibrosa TaxID=111802 RepID=A0ABW2XT31_9ACTN|nr:hypothetical protein [Actinomadura fibrosa]